MKRTAWLLLGCFAGCGRWGFDETGTVGDAGSAPVVPPPASYQSGSRLRAEVHVSGQTVQFDTWFDTQLGGPCALAVAEDGVERCVPTALFGAYQFTDPTCTTELIVTTDVPADMTNCPQTSTYAQIAVGDRKRVVLVGAAYTGPLFQGTPASCSSVGANGIGYASIGATVSPDTFVAFHDELVPSGDLAYIVHVADDGARQLDVDELVDRTTGDRCTLLGVNYGEVICMPKLAAAGRVWADAACTEPAVFTDTQATPHVLAFESHDACTEDTFDITIGDELPSFYQLDPTAGCTLSTIASGDHAFRATSVVPATPIVKGVLEPATGGRVVVANWRFPQGQSVPGPLYDTVRGDECYVISIANTFETVCAPLWSGYLPVYSDTTCATAVDGYPRCQGAWRATWYPTAPFQYTCEGSTWEVHAFDQPNTGPYYEKESQSCVAADPTVVAPLGMNLTIMPTSEMTPVTRQMD